MRMIDILESMLQYGMKIYDIKENKTKTKFTFVYKDMEQKGCEIPNTCTPGHEEDLCKKTINNIISGMYINKGDLKEAESWLHGEKWIIGKEYSNIKNNKMELLKIKVEQLIEDLENKTANQHMNDLEQGRHNALNEVLQIMDEI